MSFEEQAQKKIVDRKKLGDWADAMRLEGRTIATINGSFDLLHAGHLEILFEASLQADQLLVLLNTDESIKNYKGADRPLIPLKYRQQMVAALTFVDYVSSFSESDPCKVLEVIRPHVHINGSEYGDDCIEAETVKKGGGKLHLFARIPGLSTSTILEKMRMTCV
ncbi:MAG: adenylyltransferase/cytidyltransferase family protein [Candidatus Algichlamydia australiensis]|nr:adenylyltransferase/cytidyltransferase family protein [Chlamydiales bacterium]